MDHKPVDVIIAGGGAAGFFAAITIKEHCPEASVLILEQSSRVLDKVRISGGGRCNVTHACFDAAALAKFYPRGSRELLGPFHTFGPAETVQWFADHGVRLKAEADGRMFPVSNDSMTIVRCLTDTADRLGVTVLTGHKLTEIYSEPGSDTSHFTVSTGVGNSLSCRKLMIATGSSPSIWKMTEHMGCAIVQPVPSLFTFNLPGHTITRLMGVSVASAKIRLLDTDISTEGPLLITHWGLSGPAVLKASSWGARVLAGLGYKYTITVDWIPETTEGDIRDQRNLSGAKKIINGPFFGLPQRLYHYLAESADITSDTTWATATREQMNKLVATLKSWSANVSGKTTFKEEFVTAGGISLKEINFKTFECRKIPGLFMAGEVLDIDALTGGFNFQAAWTGGYIAGVTMAKSLATHKRP